MKRWLAVANPAAGGGRVRRRRAALQAALARAGVAADWVESEFAGHAIELAARAVRGGRRHLIAVGGDGTLNEIINGALRDGEAADATFALLPVGRGNDWARYWSIPQDADQAARLIAVGHTVAHDLGVVRTNGGERLFVNVAGAGFDAAVVVATRRLSLGPLTYLAGLLAAFLHYRALPLVLTLQPEAAPRHGIDSSGLALATFVCLTPNCGGGMTVAPGASPTDGRFDVTRIGDLARAELLFNLRRLFDGTLLSHPKVQSSTAVNVVMLTPGVPVEADGEWLGHTPASFDMRPAAARLVVPKSRSW